MASDVRIWTGTAWESIKGPKGDTGAPGPNVVSADAGNASKLGTDGRIFTPTATAGISQTDADARYVNIAGDWMSGPLTMGGTQAFTATAPLDIDASTVRVRQASTPASQTAVGEPGTICWDSAYLYACVAPNQWRRMAWRDWGGTIPNGSWSPVTVSSAPWSAIAFVNNRFVAENLGRWSTDGTNWFQSVGLTSTITYTRAVFGIGTFLLGRASSTSITAGSTWAYATSSDGANWTMRSANVGGTGFRLQPRGMCFGGGRFVAMFNTSNTATGNVVPFHSADTITWTASAAPAGLVANTLSDIIGIAHSGGTAAGLFVAIGMADGNGLATNRYITSPDGIAWTARSLPVSAQWRDIGFGNGRFVVVGTGNIALHSVDGINWSQATMPSSANWTTLAYGDGRWVVVAPLSTAAATSTDGITWTTMTLPSGANWNGIAWNGTVFVATNATNTPAIFTATPQQVTYFPISASRSLVATDASATVANVSTLATPVTITVPADATLSFPIGTSITIMDASNAAVTTIRASAGVALNWSGKLVGSSATVLGGVGVEVQIPGPLSQVVLRKVAADAWTILY